MSDTEFPEPPEEFLKYPAGNLIALMTDGDGVASVLDDLTRAGFPRDKMYVLAGPAGAERLDVTGQHPRGCGDVSTAPSVRSVTNTRNLSGLATTCKLAGW